MSYIFSFSSGFLYENILDIMSCLLFSQQEFVNISSILPRIIFIALYKLGYGCFSLAVFLSELAMRHESAYDVLFSSYFFSLSFKKFNNISIILSLFFHMRFSDKLFDTLPLVMDNAADQDKMS